MGVWGRVTPSSDARLVSSRHVVVVEPGVAIVTICSLTEGSASFTCLLLFSNRSYTPPARAPPPRLCTLIKDANERGQSGAAEGEQHNAADGAKEHKQEFSPQLPTTSTHARLYSETRVRDTSPEEPRVCVLRFNGGF